MQIILEKLKHIDLSIIFCYSMLIFIGLFMQLDISSVGPTLSVFKKQFLITVTAIGFSLFIYLFWRIKWLDTLFFIFYFIVLFLLIEVSKVGVETHGAQRALSVNLGFFSFSIQPSLLARLVLVILFARIISHRSEFIEVSGFLPFVKYFFPLLLFTGVYYSLIFKQNHLSSLLTSAFTLISIMFLAKFRKTTIIMLIVIVLLLSSAVLFFQKGGEFRQKRLEDWAKSSLIIRWIAGETDNSGIHTNNLESILCLSSGKFLGTGADGGMGKLKYLHEADTDFIYAIIGEEFGLIGSFLVLFLYMALVFKGLNISSRQSDLFAKLLGYGFCLNIFFNVIIHIGTVTSCFPTTGVTLPFISHGGSSMIANSLAIGVLLKLSTTQEQINVQNDN